jgi:hypothetical protein
VFCLGERRQKDGKKRMNSGRELNLANRRYNALGEINDEVVSGPHDGGTFLSSHS